MPIDNAFATHPGRTAEAAEKKNEDFAHAWVKDKVSYQITADGNGRSEYLNPASFVVNEIQRFVDSYSEPGMTITEIKRMISGAFHCANRVLLAFKKANGELYTNSVFATVFGSGGNDHLESSENNQFESIKNRQQPRLVY